MVRQVVVLFGPPGAGKTTAAAASGLPVYDRDDPHWTSERAFRRALEAVGSDPEAQACVIRSGATSSARAATTATVRATHAYLITASVKELQARVAHRNYRHDKRRAIAGITTWMEKHDRNDGVALFPGWAMVDVNPTAEARLLVPDPGPSPGW